MLRDFHVNMRPARYPLVLPMTLAAALLGGLSPVPARAETRIEVTGGDGVLKDNLRLHLRLAEASCETRPGHLRRLYAAVEEDIRPALHALGYYEAEIRKELDTGGDCWLATVTVDPGPPVRVRTVTVDLDGDARDDPAFEDLLADLPLKEGDQLHHGRYEAIKAGLRSLALERGYFDARLTRSTLRIHKAEQAADILIDFAAGTRYRFGELRLGEQPLEEGFVRRLGAYDPDAPYEVSALVSLDRNLSNSGYFKGVEVRPLRDQATGERIPVEVNFTRESRHAWRAGVGFATDSGPRVSAGYENRYINRRGHRFSTDVRLSPVISTLSAEYRIPGKDPHKQNYRFTGAFEHDNTDSFTSDSVNLGFFDSRRVGPWNHSRFIKVLSERSDIGNEDVSSNFVLPGIGWNRTEADDPLRTRRGYRLGLELQGTHEALLSSTSLFQVKANAKGIYRFADWGRVTGRVDLGTTLTPKFADLPASLRFFAGGDNSVRGYAFQSLGPRDSDGEVVGGKHLITASIEYEHPLWNEDWWGAAFVDAGNAFDTDDIRVKQGYGGGLRWYSPVGRIRLDIAFPDDTSEDEWRIHFGLGVDL
ncbi:MAG: autotransporter assembly complex family protein [Gammaproteobacteria bacterium]|nr:autotransporter assembly complex family protein [Gammaproteobacteria bacterium]